MLITFLPSTLGRQWKKIIFVDCKTTNHNLTVHIVIAGNIGSGKSTLAELLAKHYGWEPFMEPVVDNPYLSDYYKDIKRWSFALEVFFLKQRFKDIMTINASEKTIIQDRSIYEGVYIFTANNHEMGNMDDRDFETYMELFEQMMTIVKMPDLMIYLRSSVAHLVDNIHKRGRDYEQTMPLKYLSNLNDRYEDFVMKTYKGRKLVIDVDNMDYKNRPEDFATIVDRIDATMFGIFGPLD